MKCRLFLKLEKLNIVTEFQQFYDTLTIRKDATDVNGKGREKNLKLWEVSAKDGKKTERRT